MTGWIFTMIGIIAGFTVLAVVLLPRLLFVTRYVVDDAFDRGIRTVDDEESPSIVFEPSADVRGYISRYVLSVVEGKRVLVCKLAKPLAFVDYDIIVFDENDRVDKVFNIKDGVAGEEYTHVVELPFNTEYISIVLNAADGETFKHKLVKKTSAGRIALFILFSAMLITAAVFGLKYCCAYMFGGLYRESFIEFGHSIAVTGAIAGGVCALHALFTVIAFKLRSRKAGRK